jgi:2-oxoglutarate dehydrogenase E1 component
MLLPHGHEGSGPEHSSARPERYLQLCGSNNIQVAIPTTAAQYFHILRRQLKRSDIRKPLILMTPKSLLRDAQVASKIEELGSGTFQEILLDPAKPSPKKVKRVLFCTGKIYYELNALRQQEKRDDVTIIRIEQLYPLARLEIEEACKPYAKADIFWVQEEPQNMGAWSFVQNRLNLFVGKNVEYIGRKGSGTTAEGSGKAHAETQKRILRKAILDEDA